MALFKRNQITKAFKLRVKMPEWGEDFLGPCQFKGLSGGRGGAKSHFFGELMILEHIRNPNKQSVCIREIQKSINLSVKKLLEDKIKKLNVSHMFKVTDKYIKSINGDGMIVFMGMQDHTADSIKSLEGFDCAWVEEAQSLSKRSIDLLLPTIVRTAGAELWFSWNPLLPTDAVDMLFESGKNDPDFIHRHVNYTDNPHPIPELIKLAEHCRIHDPDNYANIWLGAHASRTDDQIFGGKWRVDTLDLDHTWDGPYHGMDFGFVNDPTTAIKVWIHKEKNILYIEHEAYKRKLTLFDTAEFVCKMIPEIEEYEIRADSSEPRDINYLEDKKPGNDYYLPKITGATKGPGSIKGGVKHILSYSEIVIHSRCKKTIREFINYKFKTDRLSGQITSEIIDDWNHIIDAIRYALEPMMSETNFTNFGGIM